MSVPVGPYTPIVRAGEWLVLSGQVGIDENKQLVEGGVVPQLRRAIGNAEALLRSEGATLTDVVKTTVFLVDMADYGAVNDEYMKAFGDHRPARSAVAVKELPLGASVEIECWARRA